MERYKALLTLILEDEDEADRMAAEYMLQQINAGVYKE